MYSDATPWVQFFSCDVVITSNFWMKQCRYKGLHAINLVSIIVFGFCPCMSFVDNILLLVVVFGCLLEVVPEGHKLCSMELLLCVSQERVFVSLRVYGIITLHILGQNHG